MKKIGLLCMALVLALGMLGVGYALWKDEVTIVGTVNTGTVEIDIVELSETYIYKNMTSREMVMSTVPLPENGLKLIASATADDVSPPSGPKTVTMNFTNIFPTPTMGYIEADVVFHYNGTVPAHVALTEDDPPPDPAIAPYLIQKWFVWDDVCTQDWIERDIDGLQLHQCNLFKLVVALNYTMLQDQGKDAQGLSGTFTKKVVVHQWNEPYPP